MIRWLTSGESHGKGLTTIIEGLPAGLLVDIELINYELSRRQKGYGRGKRMQIEKDRVEITSGVRYGKTIGSPVCLFISNKDYENWKDIMEIEYGKESSKVTSPRPGHADLAGFLKYGFTDIRNVIERASARESAARVAAGTLFKLLLKEFDIQIYSHTIAIGGITIHERKRKIDEMDNTPMRCMDPEKEKEMVKRIDEARNKRDSLGGTSEVIATGLCPGLGSYSHYDRRLDARIAHAMLSIPSVKGVEIGEAFENAKKFGSDVHDEIFYKNENGFYHKTNRAGGLEGGVSNGEDIVIHLAIKPIPTLGKPLHSVDIVTKSDRLAQKERADTCVVPAAGVIGEAMLAYVLSDAFCEKFGGDNLNDIGVNYKSYMERLKNV
ncbi:MAG: chorismate synthase [bacterium]